MSPTVRWGACQRRCRHCRPLERPHSDCCLASLRRVIASHRRSSPLPSFFSIRPLIRSGPPRCLIAPARSLCRGRRAGPVRYVEGAAPPVPGRRVAAAAGCRAARVHVVGLLSFEPMFRCCCRARTAGVPVLLPSRYCCRSGTSARPGVVRRSRRTGRPAEPPALRVAPVRPAVDAGAPAFGTSRPCRFAFLPVLLLPASAGPACPAAGPRVLFVVPGPARPVTPACSVPLVLLPCLCRAGPSPLFVAVAPRYRATALFAHRSARPSCRCASRPRPVNLPQVAVEPPTGCRLLRRPVRVGPTRPRN